HSLHHYIESIKLFGTTDNYNTEFFERLHIDFTKLGWRASNHRDEFPQMIRWLSRREKIAGFEAFQTLSHGSRAITPAPQKKASVLKMAKVPHYPGRDFPYIKETHDAPDFEFYLKQYLNRFTDKPVVQRLLDQIPLSFTKVNVYKMFRFHPEAMQDDEVEEDLVKAIPRSAALPHGHFDTVIVLVNDKAESIGVAGTKVGRVKVIFKLPNTLDTPLGPRPLPSTWPQGPLAYIEWYSPLPRNAEARHGTMYRIKRQSGNQQNRRPGSIVPLGNIRQSCMLFPAFPREGVPSDWTSQNVLDLADAFYVNKWSSKYAYHTIY
ncbi:hypothetical protein CVT26_011510, partial [Gymnopilus dilepis]